MEVVALVIKIPANTVRKKPTDYLNVDIDYSYRGPAQRIIFTAVVTQETWWSEFDEIGSTRKSVYADVPSSDTLRNYRTRVPNLPLSGVDPKATPYGVKTKAEGTFGTIEAGNKACLYVEVAPPAEYTINVTCEPDVGYVEQWVYEAGWVQRYPAIYADGERIMLIAVSPFPEYWRFSHWSGDVSGTNASKEFYIHKNMNVIAHFVAA
ncbi:hypothetical protein ES703_52478 [subsurface metagenome]